MKLHSSHPELESWFKLANHFEIVDKDNGKFIDSMYVTGDFDVKEQTSRHLHGAIGPLSDMSLVYTMTVDKPANVTFLFVDPAGQLAQVVDIHVSEKVAVTFFVPIS